MNNVYQVTPHSGTVGCFTFLLVEELVLSAHLQQVVIHVQVIQIILSVTQSLIDEQVHRGRTSNTHTHKDRYLLHSHITLDTSLFYFYLKYINTKYI